MLGSLSSATLYRLNIRLPRRSCFALDSKFNCFRSNDLLGPFHALPSTCVWKRHSFPVDQSP